MRKQVNVIGHLGSASGAGTTVRAFIRVLQANGYEVCGLDIDYHAGEQQQAAAVPIDIEVRRTPQELPFDLNFVVVAIQLLPSLWRRRCPGLLAPRFRNVGLVFWELPVIPPAWVPALGLFDALVVCSHYVRQAMELALPSTKTFFAEHPLDVPSLEEIEPAGATFRDSLGLSTSDTVFLTSFDLRSDHARKNPVALLDAFAAAFASTPDVRLVIKAHGKLSVDSEHPVVRRISSAVAADPRIVWLADTLPYERVMALHAAADVFVSLHRAEGLGLGPMEAMLLGKLLIATGYSGNMTFMTEQNSMPLDYRLVEPQHTAWVYQRRFSGANAVWAEPDHNAAVAALRSAHLDAPHRRSLGAAARADMLRRQATAWQAPWLENLERWLTAGHAPVNRSRLKRRVTFNEFRDPTLRRLNLQALSKQLIAR